MENYIEEMKKLNEKLLEASKKYYQEDVEIMTNAEYDALYDELVAMEEKYGYILPNSITQQVGSEVVSKLVKEKHEEKALSLDKTKSVEKLSEWLSDKEGILSWKLDGLTVVATYENGKLLKAVTRGNGEIGEVITHNAKFFEGLPNNITYKGKLIVRGEALMTYSEFERINSLISDASSKYKNPRNLASGTIRQLDSSVCKERKINFKAFELVTMTDSLSKTSKDTFSLRFNFLEKLGFDVVPHVIVTKDTLPAKVKEFESKIPTNDFPSDGLVLFYDDIVYGKSLGTTAKFPRNGIAFKWKDETAESVVTDIVWQTSRTGLINPVAIFDTVELEGTEVSRATANNISIMKKLGLKKGCTVQVYKANMIIPTILKVVKDGGEPEIICNCPSCGTKTVIATSDEGIETLTCPNEECPARNIKRFEHFASRNAMNIVGLSEQTLEKFLGLGLIKNLVDIYKLPEHKDTIVNLEGFGEKSYANLEKSLEDSKNVHFYNFLFALGIPNIGIATAKDMCKVLKLQNADDFLKLFEDKFDFSKVPNIGETINVALYEWYENNPRIEEMKLLAMQMNFVTELLSDSSKLSGKNFVITGSLTHFTNRDELTKKIEDLGGKVVGSVSSKTSYLINNDITSTSGKNKKAKELGIPIITEEDLIKMFE